MSSIVACRSCGSALLTEVLDLGHQPIANALRHPEELDSPEPTFPLAVLFCAECTLLQVGETVPAETLFGRSYPYYSSFSPALLRHSRDHVLALCEEFRLGARHLVVEVAGNDGYLLRNFVKAGVPVLNIDPASGPAAAAQALGIPTIVDYFGAALARRLAADGRRANLIIANNVAAHVDRINDFMAGFPALLAEDGIIEIEVAYVRDLIAANAFDTIYHEHLFYYSIQALTALVERHGLHLNDVMRIDIHGGSIRARLSRCAGESERLRTLKAEEAALGMHDMAFYRDFARQVHSIRENLRSLISDLKARGARIAAYGAAAKGATLLNYTGLDHRTIDYVVDRNAHKVGKLMPGASVPVMAADRLLEDQPAFVLLLAWNFAQEIMAQQAEYLRRGGAFVIPVPEPRIVGSA
jgi:hypothetical protein